MARIEGIKISNYRVLRDVTLGRMWWHLTGPTALTPMTAVIGKNGVGKSSLFDAFGFLADCLKLGVEEACDLRGRGGFDRIRSQGSNATRLGSRFAIGKSQQAQPITYILMIDKDDSGRSLRVIPNAFYQSRNAWAVWNASSEFDIDANGVVKG